MINVLSPEKPVVNVPESVGRQLQSVRLQRGLSLEEIAARTFIKLHYLQALEDSLYDRLPAPVYTSGYIRQYARVLGLEDAPLIQRYHQLRQQPHQPAVLDGAPAAPAFLPVLSQRDGRVHIDTVRLSEPQAMSNTGDPVKMEDTLTPTLPTAQPSRQVVDTVEGARKDALSVRYQTEQFADQVLSHLEQEIQNTLSVVRNGRSYLQKRLESYA